MTIDSIITLLPQARSIRHLADLLGVPRSTLRDFLVRNNIPSDLEGLKVYLTSNVVQTTTSTEHKDTQKIKDLIQIAELKRAVSPANQQYEYTLELKDEPAIFILWGDQHIGAAGTNHQSLYNEVETLRKAREEDDNIILALNGDLIDGYIKGSSPANSEQVLDIEEQRQVATWLIEQLQPEVTIIADHEMWSINSAGQINFTKDVCDRLGLNYAQWQAKLKLKINKHVTKTALVHHRYPGKTKMNPVKHLQDLHNERGPADIVCGGHYHSNPGAYKLSPKRQNEEDFWGLQNGTHKIGDGYGSKIHDYQGEYGIPALVICPDGTIYGFDHYSEAIAFKRSIHEPINNETKINKQATSFEDILSKMKTSPWRMPSDTVLGL